MSGAAGTANASDDVEATSAKAKYDNGFFICESFYGHRGGMLLSNDKLV